MISAGRFKYQSSRYAKSSLQPVPIISDASISKTFAHRNTAEQAYMSNLAESRNCFICSLKACPGAQSRVRMMVGVDEIRPPHRSISVSPEPKRDDEREAHPFVQNTKTMPVPRLQRIRQCRLTLSSGRNPLHAAATFWVNLKIIRSR